MSSKLEDTLENSPATARQATRIVTYRKPDGTLGRVRKPITGTETATGSATDSSAPRPALTRPVSTSNTVLVRKPDGSVVRVKRPVSASEGAQGLPATSENLTTPSTNKTAPTIKITSPVNTKPSVAPPSSSQQPSRPTTTLPDLVHSVDDVRKRKRRVNRIYNVLSKTASLIPSEHLRSDGHGHDHDDDYSVGSHSDYDSRDSDNDSRDGDHHEATGGKDKHRSSASIKSRNSHDDGDNTHLKPTMNASHATSAAKTLASATKVKVKAADNSVFKPRADSIEMKELSPKATAALAVPEIETTNEKSGLSEPSSSKGTALGSKPGMQVTEKEVCNTDSAEETKKPRRRAPRELGRRTSRLASGVAWGIALSCPILFIILAIVNATVKDKEVGNARAIRVQKINKIAVSIWPILFAAVIAQSLRMFAAYKVERGIRLITLEQLIGSHSLATSIKQPFFLQTVNWLGIGLFILWGLSPLGGQSLQYMQYEKKSSAMFSGNVSYIETSVENVAFTSNVASPAPLEVEVNAILTAGLIYDNYVERATTDMWNNTRIHQASDYLTLSHAGLSPVDDWYVSAGSHYIPYPSVLGLPISGRYISDLEDVNTTTLPVTIQPAYSGLVNFTFPYSYFEFVCASPENISLESFISNAKWDNYPPQSTLDLNGEAPPTSPLSHDAANSTWMIVIPENPSTGRFFFAYNITEGISSYDTGDLVTGQGFVASSNCSYTIQQMDVNMECRDQSACEVARVRYPSRLAHPPTANLSIGFTNSLINSLGSSSPLVAAYLLDSSTTFTGAAVDGMFDFLGLAARGMDISIPLSRLVNSYWQVGFAPDFQGNLTWGAKDADANGYVYGNVTGEFTVYTEVYGIHWTWFCVLIFCSVLLLVFGVAGIILDNRTIGPDIIGFASSITRDNRYMKLASDSSVAGGVERARALKNVEVMLQDVRADAEVGRVALGTVQGNEKSGRLQRGRLYR